MTWGGVEEFAAKHLLAVGTALGLGGGVGFQKFIRHLPAPPVASRWGGSFFDWSQDIASNNDRIGERVGPDGKSVFLVIKNPEKEQSK